MTDPTASMATGLNGWVILVSVLLVIFEVGLGVMVAINAFALKRLVSQNDRAHDHADTAIENLCKALNDEREARHADFRSLTATVEKAGDRNHELNDRVTRDYATEERVMTQHGMLVQSLHELNGKVERLIGTCAARQTCPEKQES